MRTGRYVTYGAIRCFDPRPLPPDPPIVLDGELANLLSEADRALARLDGATLTLPDPDLFVYAFMRQEAVLSSQIEGTQASLEDLLEFESGVEPDLAANDVADVVDYLDAMRWALKEIETAPVTLNLIRETHRRLLQHGRGAERAPGEFRRNQNWIGPPGCTLAEATFVPPAAPLMDRALGELERFIHSEAPLPPLLRFGLVHAQFETIHPFWDGNGRLGRMLVTLLLCADGVLHRPVLYLSLYFKAHRAEYYRRLQATRDDGDLEGWLKFFLRGVRAISRSALETARRINALRDDLARRAPQISRSKKAHLAIATMYTRPYVTIASLGRAIDATFPTTSKLIGDLERAGIVAEITGGRRDRIFAFRPYLDTLHDAIDDLGGVIGRSDHPVTGG